MTSPVEPPKYVEIEKNPNDGKIKVNLWKSSGTGVIYEAPINFLPKFNGWELVGTIEK